MRPDSSVEDAVAEAAAVFLSDRITFEELTSWLYPLYWDAIEATADGPMLGAFINLAWEHQAGTISEDKLRTLLEQALRVPA